MEDVDKIKASINKAKVYFIAFLQTRITCIDNNIHKSHIKKVNIFLMLQSSYDI